MNQPLGSYDKILLGAISTSRPLSCQAVSRILGVRIGYSPHRHTVRRWALEWLCRGTDYIIVPMVPSRGVRGRVVQRSRLLVRPAAVEKMLERMARME